MLWSDALFGQVAASLRWLWGLRLGLSLECPQALQLFPLLVLQLAGLLMLHFISTYFLKRWEQEPKHKSSHAKGQFWFLKAQVQSHTAEQGTPACQLPGPSSHRELRMLCEVLWCANQPESSVGTSPRTGPSPQHRVMDAILYKRRASALSFITVLLSQCWGSFLAKLFTGKWWNREFGMWTPELFTF